jgi:arginase
MPRNIAIIVSPFHVGIHLHRVGKGPEAILAKLEPALEERSIPYRKAIIKPVDDYDGEIGRSFAILRQIAAQTRTAVDNDEFPIILAGNCSSSVAVMAGLNNVLLDHNDVDVFWADAHADAHVPDDPGISYFDSMGTSMLTGLCWKGHLDAIEGHIPLPFSHVNFLGMRSYESEELNRIHDHDAGTLFCKTGGVYRHALKQYLLLRPQHRRAFVHVDLDVLDTSVGHANDYSCGGGLLANDFIDMLDVLAKRDPTSLTLASLDPDLTGGDKIVQLAVQGIFTFVESAGIIT